MDATLKVELLSPFYMLEGNNLSKITQQVQTRVCLKHFLFIYKYIEQKLQTGNLQTDTAYRDFCLAPRGFLNSGNFT